jgi:hypothetical protein
MVLSLITTLRMILALGPLCQKLRKPLIMLSLEECLSGPFSFVCAGGEDLALEVEDLPLLSSYEQGESSRMRSMIVGSLSLPSESA